MTEETEEKVKVVATADMADTVAVATEEVVVTEEAEAVEIAEVATETDNKTN
jgi:hypothetical protein